MYYDDEARRFNFLSGLLLGALLGTGLALLAAPEKLARKPPQRIRRAADGVRRRARQGVEEARDRAEKATQGAFTRIRAGADRTER
ncbi:MAG TPA: hypothetical protein VMN39_02190 [Longimicrobiaceae bacterium]|nr:hypothetical protein [Longimicrobiaceae bacterium]